MKTIGLIGGMSWESSVLYYRLINTGIKQRLGGLHSAQLLMYSVDFAPIEQLQHAGDWDGAAQLLIDAARHGVRIAEAPVTVKRRSSGESKKGRDWTYGLNFARTVLRTWWRD